MLLSFYTQNFSLADVHDRLYKMRPLIGAMLLSRGVLFFLKNLPDQTAAEQVHYEQFKPLKCSAMLTVLELTAYSLTNH